MVKNIIQSEQRSVLDVGACTCTNLRQAARVVTQAYDAALQPAGLKATQFALLATLVQLGEVPLTQLADALVVDRTTLTRNLKPLVRRGLIGIAHAEDQRVRNVSLTKTGRRVFEEARPHWARAQSRIVKCLGHERWSGFLGDLAATVAVARDR